MPDANGLIHVPDAPGLGIKINPAALTQYKVDVEIKVNGRQIFTTPSYLSHGHGGQRSSKETSEPGPFSMYAG